MSAAMKGTGSKAVLRVLPGPSGAEWLWGGMGVGVAALSTAFAAYMLTFGPAGPRIQDTPDFGLFAHLRPREHPPASPNSFPSDRSALDPATRTTAQASASDGPAEVDFSPTGSVRNGPADPKPSNESTSARGDSQPLPGFILRDVFDGRALVESRAELTLVAPGSVLEGAGKVLSIERQGNGWVVTTTRGIIGGAPR